MKNMFDLRYLLVVNNYSLGSIITLLEKLNKMIEKENDTKVGASNLFVEGSASSYDEKDGSFRYILETPTVEIFETFLKFADGAHFTVKNKNLCSKVLIEKENEIEEEVKHFEEIYDFTKLPGFLGISLKEWNNMFWCVVDEVINKITFFIEDFEFQLLELHADDRVTKDQVSTIIPR